jgi:hypothetical protein
MTRLRCSGCQDGRHCRHKGYVPTGTIMAPCRCLSCDPKPIQTRLFSHALVELDLGACADCGQEATKLLVGGAGYPDLSLCERCEHGRHLAMTGGRDYGNEERARSGLPPIPRPDLGPSEPPASPAG